MFDALLFDLDGTLVDTESIALRTGPEAFARHGLAVDEAFLHRLVGRDEPSSRAILAEAFPAADLDALRRDWNAAFALGIEAGLPLKPGVLDLLAATDGYPRAIVTSSGRPGALRKLELVGLADRFELVIALQDVPAPKPDPAPYLLAAARLGLPPARCLVFEDSETGAEAGSRAGCTVVQVPDVLPTGGRWAHHVATDLIAGAQAAGLLR
ncbi:HAD family hydrolase [Pseudogemmobacter sonorensis]|uniref:HAD family hydrolase n=1 Tax=Pseudogemmobacter sonorensis TaxID=2989681 RepID=UPI0036CFEBF5